MQDSDIRYIVRSFWDSRSIMSGQTDLYELRLVRYLKDEEWSPWNCILLTHQEADIHAQLGNLFKVCQNSGFLMKKAAQYTRLFYILVTVKPKTKIIIFFNFKKIIFNSTVKT